MTCSLRADDVRDVQPLALRARLLVTWAAVHDASCSGQLGSLRWQRIERAANSLAPSLGHMHVTHRASHARMTQQHLHGAQVDSVFEQVTVRLVEATTHGLTDRLATPVRDP